MKEETRVKVKIAPPSGSKLGGAFFISAIFHYSIIQPSKDHGNIIAAFHQNGNNRTKSNSLILRTYLPSYSKLLAV